MAKTDELQFDRAPAFLDHERRAQRLGVIALSLFVLAGAVGVFGAGPFSDTRTTTGGTDLEYERFSRVTVPTTLVIRAQTHAADGDPVRFRLERTFLRDITLIEIRPSEAFRGFDGTAALFEVDAMGGLGHLELRYEPNRFGVFQTSVTPETGEAVRLWQLIYF